MLVSSRIAKSFAEVAAVEPENGPTRHVQDDEFMEFTMRIGGSSHVSTRANFATKPFLNAPSHCLSSYRLSRMLVNAFWDVL